MPRIPETVIDQVRQSVDIVDVVSDYVMLTRRGKSFLGLCPFHDDSNPSMNVSQDKQIFKCFSCGAGGNVFTFVRDMENISFIEAVRKLAERAGISLPESQPGDAERQEVYDQLYAANELALKYFHHMLMAHAQGETAREYLLGRDISRDTMADYGLGYALNRWDGFIQAATKRGFSPEVLEKAGLILPRRDGKGFYDRFRHRIMFPIHATTGRPVAFGARALDPEERAKYLNSPETPVYNKSATLYGLWGDRDAIRDAGVALVVEGYMDLIALGQSGIKNTVASSGTALTIEHARLLQRYAPRVILIFDGDAAGTTAAVRGIGSLFESGLEVRVVALPENHDPDSFVRERGPDGFQSLLDMAQPAADYLLEQISRREDLSTVDGKARAAHEFAELVGRIKDRALRQFLIKDLAEKLGLDEEAFIQVLRSERRPSAGHGHEAQEEAVPPPFDPRPRAEREVISLMLKDAQIADAILQQVSSGDFTNGAYRRIADLIAQNRAKNTPVDAAHLIDQCDDVRLGQILSDLSLEPGDAQTGGKWPIDDYLRRFQLKALERELDAVEARLRQALPAEELRAVMEQHRELTTKRKALLAPQAS